MPIQKAKAGPATREDVDQALLGVGRLQLRVDALENEMNARIDELKAEYAPKLESLSGRITGAAERLRLAVQDSRQDLFKRRSKTLQLLFGRVGFRDQRATIRLADGVKTADAVRFLQRSPFPGLVRVKGEVDKQAAAGALARGDVTEDQLKRCGLRVRPGGEDWFYELDRASIQTELEKAG